MKGHMTDEEKLKDVPQNMETMETRNTKAKQNLKSYYWIGVGAFLLLLVLTLPVWLIDFEPKWVHASTERVEAYAFVEKDHVRRLHVETETDFLSLRNDPSPFYEHTYVKLLLTDATVMKATGLYLDIYEDQFKETGKPMAYILHVPKDEYKTFVKAYLELYNVTPTFMNEEEIRTVEEEAGISLTAGKGASEHDDE